MLLLRNTAANSITIVSLRTNFWRQKFALELYVFAVLLTGQDKVRLFNRSRTVGAELNEICFKYFKMFSTNIFANFSQIALHYSPRAESDLIIFSFFQEVDKEPNSPETFAIETVEGKGVISLVDQLDYERKSLYQLRILAIVSARCTSASLA